MMHLWEEHYMTRKPRGVESTVTQVLRIAKKAGVHDVILIGAGALATYGAPRYSEDLDFLLAHPHARRLVKHLLDAEFKGPP